jgi:hypothetical protein
MYEKEINIMIKEVEILKGICKIVVKVLPFSVSRKE